MPGLDYILRQAIPWHEEEFEERCHNDRWTERLKIAFKHEVDAIPAVDARPVVLCRDCEHYVYVMYGGTRFEYGFCARWADGTRMNPDDFCSRSKKREET